MCKAVVLACYKRNLLPISLSSHALALVTAISGRIGIVEADSHDRQIEAGKGVILQKPLLDACQALRVVDFLADVERYEWIARQCFEGRKESLVLHCHLHPTAVRHWLYSFFFRSHTVRAYSSYQLDGMEHMRANVYKSVQTERIVRTSQMISF